MQCTLTDLPLLAAEAQDMKEHREEADSKRIHEQHMEPGIVDHAIHDFLSARGEADRWGALPPVDQTTKSLSDLHTGISSLGDSTLQSHQSQPAGAAPSSAPFPISLLAPFPPPPPPPSPQRRGDAAGHLHPDGEQPLYDQLPCRSAEDVTSAPTSEAASQPASIISDSVTYCGRFPAMDSSHYRQCGEARRLGGHTSAVTDTGLEQEAVTTAGPQWSCTSRKCRLHVVQHQEPLQHQALKRQGGGRG